MNLTLQAFKANSPSGIDAAFVRMASDQAQALMILADSSPPWSTADRTHAGPSLSITTGFGRPIWPIAPFAIAFSIGFVLGAVTVVSTYDRECPSHEHELSETEQPDDLRGS